MPDQPVAHLPRTVPPWEEVRHTHCGRLILDVVKMSTVEAYVALAKREGKKRAAYDYCQNCAERVAYGTASWERNATAIMLDWLSRTRWSNDSTRFETTASLHAIAALIEAHKDEFVAHRDATKNGIASLNEKRTFKRESHLRGLS